MATQSFTHAFPNHEHNYDDQPPRKKRGVQHDREDAHEEDEDEERFYCIELTDYPEAEEHHDDALVDICETHMTYLPIHGNEDFEDVIQEWANKQHGVEFDYNVWTCSRSDIQELMASKENDSGGAMYHRLFDSGRLIRFPSFPDYKELRHDRFWRYVRLESAMDTGDVKQADAVVVPAVAVVAENADEHEEYVEEEKPVAMEDVVERKDDAPMVQAGQLQSVDLDAMRPKPLIRGRIVPESEWQSSVYASRFERTKVLGAMATHARLGGPVPAEAVDMTEPNDVARVGLKSPDCPYVVERTMPNDEIEIIPVSKLRIETSRAIFSDAFLKGAPPLLNPVQGSRT